MDNASSCSGPRDTAATLWYNLYPPMLEPSPSHIEYRKGLCCGYCSLAMFQEDYSSFLRMKNSSNLSGSPAFCSEEGPHLDTASCRGLPCTPRSTRKRSRSWVYDLEARWTVRTSPRLRTGVMADTGTTSDEVRVHAPHIAVLPVLQVCACILVGLRSAL